MMKRLLPFLLAAWAVCACTYPFSPELPADSQDRQLVVEGNILIGETSPFRLSVVHPLSDASVVPSDDDGVASATLTVEDDSGLNYPVSGNYLTGFRVQTESAPAGRQYRLTVRVVWAGIDDEGAREEIYQTPWLQVRTAPKIGDIRFEASDSQVSVLASMEPTEQDNPFYYWEFDENWEVHSQYTPGYGFDPEAQEYYSLDGWVNPNYYCWKSATSREAVLYSTERLTANRVTDHPFRAIHRTDTRMQVLYAINVRARGISPDGYRYYRTVAANSNLTGDLFSAMPDRVGGNLLCTTDPSRTAVGFVDAVTTASKRVFIDSRYYREALPEQRFVPVVDEDYTLVDHYLSGFRPLYEGTDSMGASGMLWCPLACIDCVVNGGTKDKPAYWPNDHK